MSLVLLLLAAAPCPSPDEVAQVLERTVRAPVLAQHRWSVTATRAHVRVRLETSAGLLVRERVLDAPPSCAKRALLGGTVLAAWMMEQPSSALEVERDAAPASDGGAAASGTADSPVRASPIGAQASPSPTERDAGQGERASQPSGSPNERSATKNETAGSQPGTGPPMTRRRSALSQRTGRIVTLAGLYFCVMKAVGSEQSISRFHCGVPALLEAAFAKR